MDRTWRSAALLALWLAAPLAAAETNPLTDSPTWEELRADVVGDYVHSFPTRALPI